MADEREARERYEDEGRRQELARREWMPAPLGGRVVLALGGGRAFWVDAFRGYPDGVVFLTRYRWVAAGPSLEDPDAWPTLGGHLPSDDPVTVTADVDGGEAPRSSAALGGRALHTGSGNGLPGIATAEWWLPEVPRESLTLAFSHPSIGLAGSAVVDARGWAAEIAAHAIRIG
ncbi:hypothetical protein BFL36_10395 [Clavibacter michiganensis]|uniref:Uncharacterized protein n=1 Tax=Clavibacter michiganensis TaxID=28447 RepID=A0A251YDL1_9MICO|nr:hypothetical protein [Clavibacter michiganensis]OUE22332.1 hypothetical protein BFL36_10395 [Clavibacter michiganensis]